MSKCKMETMAVELVGAICLNYRSADRNETVLCYEFVMQFL